MHRPSSIKPALKRVQRIVSKCFTHTTCFGAFRGILYFMQSSFWPRSKGQIVSVNAPGYPVPLCLRLGTTDIEVFNSIYHHQEYGWRFSASPSVIVDAGAYIGLSTAFFAMRYPKAKIIAIEPNQENFDLLVKNTIRFSNVTAIRAALSAESGSVYLTDPGVGPWGFRLKTTENLSSTNDLAAKPCSLVPTVTMDEIIQKYDLGRIDLLKLDIEGSEKDIFAVSDSWIKKVEAICLELHDRFRTGCSRAFFKAIDEFPIELRNSEDILVLRDKSSLGSVISPCHINGDASSHRVEQIHSSTAANGR